MSLGDPIPVRFSVAADQRLADVARRSGLSKAELIRLATDEFLERVVRKGMIEQRIVLTKEDGSPLVERLPPPASKAKKK